MYRLFFYSVISLSVFGQICKYFKTIYLKKYIIYYALEVKNREKKLNWTRYYESRWNKEIHFLIVYRYTIQSDLSRTLPFSFSIMHLFKSQFSEFSNIIPHDDHIFKLIFFVLLKTFVFKMRNPFIYCTLFYTVIFLSIMMYQNQNIQKNYTLYNLQ